MEKMSRIESRTGGIGSVDYNHYSAPRSKCLADFRRAGCGILSADSTDQSGLGVGCTLDIFRKSIRIAEKSELKCLSEAGERLLTPLN